MESTLPLDDRASGSPKRDGTLSQEGASNRYVESDITVVRQGASEEEGASDGAASVTDGEAGLGREEGSDRSPEGGQVTGAVQAKAAAPAWKNRLSTRIVISSVVALSLVLSMVGWTLWLSWQLAGTAAAINETGSLRMRANRIGLNLLRHDEAAQAQVVVDLREQGRILAHFAGDLPGRPLFLSTDAPLRQQFHAVTTRWDELADLAHEALVEGDSTAYLAQLPGFVAEADRLVHVLEVGNASKTTRLRILQSVLIVMACLGTMAMIFLLYRWIIRPVQTLQGGIQRMAARDFSVRVPVNNTDELGVLAQGFNRMVDELQSLYEDLGEHVRQKTAELERQNLNHLPKHLNTQAAKPGRILLKTVKATAKAKPWAEKEKATAAVRKVQAAAVAKAADPAAAVRKANMAPVPVAEVVAAVQVPAAVKAIRQKEPAIFQDLRILHYPLKMVKRAWLF